MGGHVVGAFLLVAVAGALGHQAGEEGFEVGAHIRVGILLHQQRGGGVAAPDRQQPRRHPLAFRPGAHRVGDGDEAFPAGPDGQAVQRLSHGVPLSCQRPPAP